MRRYSLVLTAPVMLAGALALPLGARDASRTSPNALPRRVEVARLRAHFDSVDTELRHSKGLRLSPSQQRARTTLIGWLREYRNAGAFPRNDRFPERAIPFFRDSQGALCAMAYLIQRSGRRDLVDRIASTRNNAFIADLADDSELRAWLDSVGLSVTEAARIQPGYAPPPIVAFIAQYDSAWKQRDTSAVSQVLAPRYQYFSSRGRVSYRPEVMAMLSSPEYRLEHAK